MGDFTMMYVIVGSALLSFIIVFTLECRKQCIMPEVVGENVSDIPDDAVVIDIE